MASGIVGLVILVLNIYAIVMIVQSSAKVLEKVLWALLVLLLPLAGLILWYLLGPGKKPA